DWGTRQISPRRPGHPPVVDQVSGSIVVEIRIGDFVGRAVAGAPGAATRASRSDTLRRAVPPGIITPREAIARIPAGRIAQPRKPVQRVISIASGECLLPAGIPGHDVAVVGTARVESVVEILDVPTRGRTGAGS